jgi:hypothetical protein
MLWIPAVSLNMAMSWHRWLVAGLPSRRLGFDPGSVHVGFVVDEVTLRQVFPRVLLFSPANFIPSVLHYKTKKLIVFITGLHNKPLGCGASVASAAGLFSTKEKNLKHESVQFWGYVDDIKFLVGWREVSDILEGNSKSWGVGGGGVECRRKESRSNNADKKRRTSARDTQPRGSRFEWSQQVHMWGAAGPVTTMHGGSAVQN